MEVEMKAFSSREIKPGEMITPVKVYYTQKRLRRKDIETGGRRFLKVSTKHLTKNRTLRAIIKEVYGK
jgi:hypothetical protein